MSDERTEINKLPSEARYECFREACRLAAQGERGEETVKRAKALAQYFVDTK